MPELAHWTFPCTVGSIVDGDTIDLMVDMGFRTTREVRVRLNGVDTAEMYGVDDDSEEYATAQQHRQFVKEWVQRGFSYDADWPFVAETEKGTGKYGRYIAISLTRKSDGNELITDLIEQYPNVSEDYDG